MYKLLLKPLKECLYCKKNYPATFLDQKFCNKSCRKLMWKKLNRDKENTYQRKRWKELHPVKNVSKICLFCNKRFICSKWNPYQIYCSKKCVIKHSNYNRSLKRKQIRENRLFKCSVCKKEYCPVYSYQKTCGSRKCTQRFYYLKVKDTKSFKTRHSFEQRNRKHKIRANGGNLSRLDWEEIKKKQDYICNICGKSEPEVKLTIDHILQIRKGGIHSKENIQALCISCNSKKH